MFEVDGSVVESRSGEGKRVSYSVVCVRGVSPSRGITATISSNVSSFILANVRVRLHPVDSSVVVRVACFEVFDSVEDFAKEGSVTGTGSVSTPQRILGELAVSVDVDVTCVAHVTGGFHRQTDSKKLTNVVSTLT